MIRWLGVVLGHYGRRPARAASWRWKTSHCGSNSPLDIREAVIAPRSPWQNAYAERVIGSIRRECLDHFVVIGERHLRGMLSKYVDYYNRTRTHLALTKDAPEHRTVQGPRDGRVVEVPRVGGLHHEYVRRAA
jgi:putative transposase